MGFWDTVKKVAISAKCMTGWHAGEYSHIQGKPKCYFEKNCPDCHEHITTRKHKFGEWEYPKAMTCNARRVCVHCGDDDFSEIHNYQRVGKSSSDCKIIERCTRCGHEKFGRTEHEWGTFFGNEIKVHGKRICKNCRKIE